MRIASKATKGKGKRWTKGGSSSSNPQANKHRLQAKSLSSMATLSRPESQQSLRLTSDSLTQHNLNQMKSLSISKTSIGDNSDMESIGGQSFASVWTNCSNISFHKLLLRFDSSSAIHKQMLSVLAAITETIHSNGGKETETEYFAALMTCLETVDNEESLTAILSLIEMVIKRLPPNVIRLKFSETSKVFVEYLAKYIKGDNGLIIRSLTNSMASLLLQQEIAVWELSSTKHILEIILSLSVHNKPRIRKCAQKAIARILRSNVSQSKTTLCHPMAKLSADFCIRKLEENGVNDNINATLYILLLLTDILSVLPNSSLKKCCESILTHMTFGNVLIVSTAFKAFFILFSSQPNEDILTPELNAKLISALYDYQPNINDSQPLCAWFQTIQRAFANLNRIDKKLCSNHLPKLFNISIACLLSDSKEVDLCITNNLKVIYTDCVESSALNIEKHIIEKIYSSVEKSLQFEYCNAWSHVFGLISHMFNNNFSEFTTNIINKLIVIRESYDCVYASDIDHSIGTAIQIFGPKYVVQLCPLNLNDDTSDVSHNWLIPVLRDNIKNSELSLFVEYFVPLITVLEKSYFSLESEGKQTAAKTCSILVSQIWSLLPSFCKQPNDFDKSFKKIAQLLGRVLSNNVSLRGYVLMAFRNISKSLDNHLIRKELNKFSKNFIPILFNIYTTEYNLNEEKDKRFSTYEVIRIFLSVSEESLLMSLYSKLIEKFKTNTNNSFMSQSLMDLIRLFVSYVTENDINYIYNQLVLPFIQNNQLITEQKKAFRILEEICRNESNVCRKFFNKSLVDITNLLIESLSKCLSSSKSFILKSLKEIIEKNSSNEAIDWKKLFIEIIPKIFNCFHINSKKVKTSAFDLIIGIANAYQSLNGANLEQFIELILSFLPNNQISSSAVIMTLTHLYSEFRKQIPKHIECDLIENIISSIGSDNRQTIQSSIDFLKYFFRSASADQLSAYLEPLIHKLSNINSKHKNHFRVKIKEIFVRLVRKYGYPMISKMIPEEYKKVLKNIRKFEDRKKKKNEIDNQSNSDRQTIASKSKRRHEFEDIIADSSDEESDLDEQMTDISQQNKTWIKEESNENEIIDLLSTKISKNILHKNPESNSKQKEECFEISSDGKIVIQDLDKTKKGIKRSIEDNDSDNHQNIDNNDSDDDMISKPSVKTSKSKESGYKTGGKGIHRPVNKELGEEYRSNKAKGDMKRKGRPDPYAYIPLNRQMLNKRKKAKLSGRFNNLIKAAQKGAKSGSTAHSKKKHKH